MYLLYRVLYNTKLKKIPQNYLVFFGSVIVAIVILVVFVGFSSSSIPQEPEKIFVQRINGDNIRVELNDYLKISDMSPNTSAFFYYPNSKDTKNRDAFETFQIIRLPIFLGGEQDKLSAIRAYSALDISSHCITKYWPQEDRMKIEDPCGGNSYNPLNGALIQIGGNPVLIEQDSALPNLELIIDEQDNIFVKPPSWRTEKNGVIGIGREASPQEKNEYELMITQYQKTLKEKLDSINLPKRLPTGHEYFDTYEDFSTRTFIYKNQEDQSVVNILYEWCDCTKSPEQVIDEESKPNFRIDEYKGQVIYAYPNHVNSVSGENTQYTFVFYKDGFKIKIKTWMDFDSGYTLLKNIFS